MCLSVLAASSTSTSSTFYKFLFRTGAGTTGFTSSFLHHFFTISPNSANSYSRSRSLFSTSSSDKMANSKFEYVRNFEQDTIILPNCWSIVRIDGRGFHKLAEKHEWSRPNDTRAIDLMNKAAKVCMKEFCDVILAYGQSDEYSFVFRREAEIFDRRSSKVVTTLVSKFAAAYVFHWNDFFQDRKLLYPPSFDGRVVLYPTDQNLRDYLSWRQADCHINNLYNTVFWALVLKGGMKNDQAVVRLNGTLAADKNEILFSEFGVNYNNEPEVFKKGTTLYRNPYVKKSRKTNTEESSKELELKLSNDGQTSSTSANSNSNTTDTDTKDETRMVVFNEVNCDIIGDKFWNENSYLLQSNTKYSK